MGVWQLKLWRARLLRRLGPEITAHLCAGYQLGQVLIVPPEVDFGGPALSCHAQTIVTRGRVNKLTSGPGFAIFAPLRYPLDQLIIAHLEVRSACTLSSRPAANNTALAKAM
jgi:hypothetical protein